MYTKLDFYRTTKPRNNTGIVTKDVKSYPKCLIKEESGIVRPTIVINFTTAMGAQEFLSSRYNYMHWEDVGRYYYIEEVILRTATVMEIDCVVDPLASFQEDILNTYAFVQYAQSRYDSMIPDNRIAITDRSEMHEVKTSALFTGTSVVDGCFIVTIATPDSNGVFGPAQVYAMSSDEIQELSSHLYLETFWDKLADIFLSPGDVVISCIWIPVAIYNVKNSDSESISVLGYELGSGSKANRTYENEVEIEPYVQYRSVVREADGSTRYDYGDYRNCEPYTEYSIWLPGAGLTQIPMISLIGSGREHPKFKVHYNIAITTGDITYTIRRVNDVEGDDNTVLVVKGNFAVQIPIAKGESSLAGSLASLLAMAGSLAVVALAPESMPFIGAGAAISGAGSMVAAVTQSMQQSYGAVGAVGGWAQSQEQLQYFYTYTKVKELSDAPGNIEDTIGRPLFATMKLGDLVGVVRCTGAFVAPDGATDEEQRMIAQYVNSSANFIFGGLIVCPGSYDG